MVIKLGNVYGRKLSSAWICWECQVGRASWRKHSGQNQDLEIRRLIGLELSISALNTLCLCVKCTNRSYDAGEITKEENGDGKMRTEFCKKSIFEGQKEEKLVNKEGVTGEEVRESGLGGIREASEEATLVPDGRVDGPLLRTEINLPKTQGWDRQGIG